MSDQIEKTFQGNNALSKDDLNELISLFKDEKFKTSNEAGKLSK
jgi:hypothetical protein